MFWSTGLVLLLAISQVPAELVKPKFIENVINEASKVGERIISGWEATPGQIPYHAGLELISAAERVIYCSGSIISREWVITTAQCTTSRVTAVVYAGLISFTNPLPEYISETREIYIHPSYVYPSLRFDISVIKLQRPVTYTNLLQPIRLQTRADAFRNYDKEVVIASGFGATRVNGPRSEVLRWVHLIAVSNRDCRQSYDSNTVFDNTICARYYTVTNQNTCTGDNGGPLVHVDSDGVDTLIGITSFFYEKCDSTRPNGFLRPGPFHSWLEEVTGIDFENLDESTTLQPTTEPTTTPLTTEPEPETSQTDVPTTAEPPLPPTTPEPEGESEEDGSSEEDGTKVIVLVKVKVKVNNIIKKVVEVK